MSEVERKRKPRKKRRADGTLRPAVRRSKGRRSREKRQAWLKNFKPGDRERFFKHVIVEQAIWLGEFAKVTGSSKEMASSAMEHIARARRWRKLRTLDGLVVGIAPPKPERVSDAC